MLTVEFIASAFILVVIVQIVATFVLSLESLVHIAAIFLLVTSLNVLFPKPLPPSLQKQTVVIQPNPHNGHRGVSEKGSPAAEDSAHATHNQNSSRDAPRRYSSASLGQRPPGDSAPSPFDLC